MTCCQRASVASNRSVEPSTCCLPHASCRRSARSRRLTCTLPSWTWRKPSIPSAATASGASWVSLDALTGSSRWFVSSMTAFRLKFLTKVSHQLPSQWQTEWNKAACWLQHCSAWRSQPCWQMPSRTPITASTSDTEGTASCSTCDVFRPRPRSTLTSSVTSCSLMIVPSMPVVLKTCSTPWTCSPLPVHHLWFYNQHQEDCGNVLTCSRETVPRTNSYRERTETGRLWTSSRTSAAYCLAVCTLKMRLMPGLPRPVWPLAGCAHRCGSARVWVSQWSCASKSSQTRN